MVPMARSHFPCPCSTPPVSRRPTDRSQGSRAKDGSGPRSSSRYKWGEDLGCLATEKTHGKPPWGSAKLIPNAAMKPVLRLADLGIQRKKTSTDNVENPWKSHSFLKKCPIICHNVASPTAWKPPFGDGGVNGCTLMRKTHSNWSVTRAKHFMRKALPVFSKNATLASPKIKHRKVLEGWYRWCWPHRYQMSNCAI